VLELEITTFIYGPIECSGLNCQGVWTWKN
jgi:hypothetical protein